MIWVAIAVNEDGYRKVLVVAEGMKEDKASWVNFFQGLKGRGLDGVKLIVGTSAWGCWRPWERRFLAPDTNAIRCISTAMFSLLWPIQSKACAQNAESHLCPREQKGSPRESRAVVAELRAMKLREAADKVEYGVEEILTYCDLSSEHGARIRTNNVIERLNQEIRRRTRVVGAFPDGNSALRPVPGCAM